MAGPTHYELYVRKTPPAPWSLLLATEDRKTAIEQAEEQLKEKLAVAVRVTKETMDPDTMEFASVTVLTRGAPEQSRKRPQTVEDAGPRCSAPNDLYAPLARELLGRSLEDWLKRQGITPYELLHRPDMVERLEASGIELQHAIQKVAVPESHATGQPAHELIRHYQKLAERASERVIKAGRGGLFADLEHRRLDEVARKIAGSPDRAFVMGGTLCGAIQDVRGGRARLDRLMDLADQAPLDGPPRALVMVSLEQLLIEIFATRTSLAEILGPALDQGASLAAVVRMVAPNEIEALIEHDPRMALLMPAVDGPVLRLARRLAQGEYPLLAASLARMVLRELMSPRRLRPSDPTGEIDILRVLAMALTATTGRLLTHDEVQSAFTERSRSLVTADFVAMYVKDCETVVCEAEQLTRLCENVTGSANKRSAARWLVACISSLRFETELRASNRPPLEKMGLLATLQRSVRAAALSENDEQTICQAIGAVGGVIEAEARIVSQIIKAAVPVPRKLAMLLRLAAGETGPLGAPADRARTEAVRLFRDPAARAAIHAAPETAVALKGLMQAAGLAA